MKLCANQNHIIPPPLLTCICEAVVPPDPPTHLSGPAPPQHVKMSADLEMQRRCIEATIWWSSRLKPRGCQNPKLELIIVSLFS